MHIVLKRAPFFKGALFHCAQGISIILEMGRGCFYRKWTAASTKATLISWNWIFQSFEIKRTPDRLRWFVLQDCRRSILGNILQSLVPMSRWSVLPYYRKPATLICVICFWLRFYALVSKKFSSRPNTLSGLVFFMHWPVSQLFIWPALYWHGQHLICLG